MKPTRGARRLFQLIHRFIHKSGAFYASQAWIAKNLKTSVRSVKRWTAELVDGGYIFHTSGRQHSATYRILKDLPPKLAPHFPPKWHLIGTSLAPHIKEEPFNSPSGSELLPSEEALKAVLPAVIEDASERLANKNLKSQIEAQLRSGNRMPVPKMPPVPESLRQRMRHASGDYR